WLTPPPQRTAWRSRARSPGVVLRVSVMRTPVPSTASTKRRVRVATPLMRCRRFRAIRSAWTTARAGPLTTASSVPAVKRSPSAARARTRVAGSVSRKAAVNTSRPESTPSWRAASWAVAGAASGRVTWPVRAPQGAAAASAALTTRSIWAVVSMRVPPRGSRDGSGRRRSPGGPAAAPPSSPPRGGAGRRGLDGQHPFQGPAGRLGDVLADADAVDGLPLQQRLEHPGEVAGVDAVHRRAWADDRVQAEDGVLRVLGGQALDQVDLGADGEGGGLGGLFDGAADVVGGAGLVGRIDHGHRALGMDDHAHPRVLGAGLVDLAGGEALVHRAESVPQHHLRVSQRLLVVAAERAARIPHRHL